ncbi:carbohydrate kinase family protein [Hymenobacter sp. HD11105]
MRDVVVCFGEILWDVLPSGKQPGGAPFNVAVHLHQFGQSVELISRVGDDDLGTELVNFLESRGVSTKYVQRAESHPTGVVQVNVDDLQEVVYQIVQPVAWDYIQYNNEVRELVAGATVFVYGSLAARSPATRETLYELLRSAQLKVFDVNMRPPHYTQEVITHLLEQAEIVKMNHHELAEILDWFGSGPDDEAALASLASRFGLQAVCVTLGVNGAMLWAGGQLYRAPGFKVDVEDTIGSGDAFLAAFLQTWLSRRPYDECLRIACASGALVATYQGATPALSQAQIAELLELDR